MTLTPGQRFGEQEDEKVCVHAEHRGETGTDGVIVHGGRKEVTISKSLCKTKFFTVPLPTYIF